MAKRGRPIVVENSTIISIRFDGEELRRLHDIANLERIVTGRNTTAHSLIRDAVWYVFSDNDRMRDCFRRCKGCRQPQQYKKYSL